MNFHFSQFGSEIKMYTEDEFHTAPPSDFANCVVYEREFSDATSASIWFQLQKRILRLSKQANLSNSERAEVLGAIEELKQQQAAIS